MVALQVFGYDHPVAFAGSQGSFQLNAYKPVVAQTFGIRALIAERMCSFNARCASGIESIAKRIKETPAQISLLAYHEDLQPQGRRAQAGFSDGRAIR